MSFRNFCLAALPCAALLAHLPAHAASDPAIARVVPPAGTQLAAIPDTAPMRVILALPLRDPQGAAYVARAVSDPGSKLYGHYLKPAEFGARFGADAAAYAAIRGWAAAHGLTVGRPTSSRTTVSMAGTVGQFAQIFSTRFASYQTPRGEGRVALSEPRLPAELAGRISGVIGLEHAGARAFLARPNKPGAKSDYGTGVGGYAPSDIISAYRIKPQASSTPTETVALFEQGGYPASDLTAYESQYNLPNVPVTLVGVNGSSTADNDADIEVDLDLDALVGINPAIARIVMYIDSYENDSFQTALVDSLNQMAEDDSASVISISYGQDEAMQGVTAIQAENTALMQLESQGQTVFVSSGDDGAAGRTGSGLNAPDPGSQPLVTSVGGTTLKTHPGDQTWRSETTWDRLRSGYGATGGGVSSIWTIPDYQVVNGTSVAVANGGSATMRNVPDIAADADPYTAYSIYCANYGGFIGVGGTSLSAPLWAAMTSIINADLVNAGKPRVGFLNPLLYKLGVTEKGFHDITVGHNGVPGYKAGPGYDNVTGFGSIVFSRILPKFTGN